ncbi:MAG TPA: signal peptidase I [Actinomycetota bacterium]|nr:signal peptidase I [Actinomycetota bacterium]
MAVGPERQPEEGGASPGAPAAAESLTASPNISTTSQDPASTAPASAATSTSAAEPTTSTPDTDVPDGPNGEGPGGGGGGRSGRHERRESSGPLGFLRELPVLLLIAFVLALLIKTFLVQAFFIPSVSMDPTLKVGDRVLVNKLTYRFHEPGRGDVIVFEDPNAPPVHRNPVSAFAHWVTDGLGLTTSPDKDFIKRVIGLPGETVEVKGGKVFINGAPLSPEPYLSPIVDSGCCEGRTWHVPQGDLFVMGDNRTDSNDSRGTLGFIPISKVVGRAFVIIWPPSRIHWLSTPHYSSS